MKSLPQHPIKTVPQANSWSTFDAVFDHVVAGLDSATAIAAEMQMAPSAVAYYLQLGEWLGLFERMELTARGHRYRLDQKDKSLARDAMMEHAWFSDSVTDSKPLKAALTETLAEQSALGDATIARRVSGLLALWDNCNASP